MTCQPPLFSANSSIAGVFIRQLFPGPEIRALFPGRAAGESLTSQTKTKKKPTMSDYCDYKVENGITIIRFTRVPDVAATKAVIDEMAAANQPQQLRLWDMRSIVVRQSQDDLREVACHAAASFHESSRAAFVADDDLSFGKLRMFEVYSDQQPTGAKVRVFRDIDAATKWLLKE